MLGGGWGEDRKRPKTKKLDVFTVQNKLFLILLH